MEGREERSSQVLSIDGREALSLRVEGKVDGVRVEVATTVLKKDSCVYDLVLVAPPSAFEAALAGFFSVQNGFRTRGD